MSKCVNGVEVCDFCRYYDFPNERCEHPDHPKSIDPSGWCEDYRCFICDPPLEAHAEPDA